MKTKLLIIALLSSISLFSQVGIGTTNPQGALDITSTNDGLLIPRIALSATNVATVVTPTVSELVYNTTTSVVGPNQVTPGYYYWNGTAWIRLLSAQTNDWSLIGNAGTTLTTNFLGTTDNVGLNFRTNNAVRATIGNTGNIGIGNIDQVGSRTFSYSNSAAIDALTGYSAADGGTGVYGRSQGVNGWGVAGSNDDDGIAVIGINLASGIGVQGQAAGNNGTAVVAIANGNNARGVIGQANGINGRGINGQTSGVNGLGVAGFVSGAGGATTPIAIYGQATGVSSIGVFGSASGANATNSAFGIYGTINNPSGTGNTDAAAIAGINSNATQGLGYAGPNVMTTPSAIVGISGSVASKRTNGTNQSYYFGVMGELLVDSGIIGATIQRRSGGAIGIGVTGVWGSAGYRDSGGNDYGIYSTSALNNTSVGNGRISNSVSNGGIGIGVNGGVIGGYINGEQYGFITKGNQFGAYIMGNTITNKPITIIETLNNNKVVSYVTTSSTVDVATRGKGQLTNGSGFVSFDTAFTQMAELNDENLNITITAKGNTNGIYIEKITNNGFYVKENMDGNHSVAFNWTATSVRKGYENGVVISPEVLDVNWEDNISKVMHNENNQNTQAQPIHFDGSKVKFEQLPKQFEPQARKSDNSKNIMHKASEELKEVDFKEKEIITRSEE